MARALRPFSWLLTRLGNAWNHVWFQEAPPYALVIGRLVLCWTMWLRLGDVPWEPVPLVTTNLTMAPGLYRPVSLVGWLGLPIPSAQVLNVVYFVTIVTLLLTALGAFTSWSSKLFAAGTTYLLTLRNCWMKVNHSDHVPVAILIILAFAPAGDAFSLDAWWRRWRSRSRPALAALPRRSWRYHWPWRAWQLAFGLMLFFASYSKLTTSGLEWITSPNLRYTILERQFNVAAPDPSPIALWVSAEPIRWQTAAAAAVLTQALFVTIVLFRNLWLQFFLLAAGLGFLLGLRVLMHLPNPRLELMLLMLVDYNQLIERGQALGWRALNPFARVPNTGLLAAGPPQAPAAALPVSPEDPGEPPLAEAR